MLKVFGLFALGLALGTAAAAFLSWLRRRRWRRAEEPPADWLDAEIAEEILDELERNRE